MPFWSPRTGSIAAARMCGAASSLPRGAWGYGLTGEGQLHSGCGTRSGGTGQGPAEDLTLKYKVKVLILVSRKTVTRDPIRKTELNPGIDWPR